MNQTKTETMVNEYSSKVVIDDPNLLHQKKAAIRLAGPSKFQVIADFDNTLTRYWVNGCRGQSSHGLLQQENPEYNAKRGELFDYYHPIEYDPQLPIDEKTKLMEEWWGKAHGLLIEGGLTYDAIRNSVSNSLIAFREGVVELFEFLEERDIPVLIFSAGLADVIEEVGETDDQMIDSASLKKRTNVLLLGDHMGDLRMSDGLNYENRISVGFLNHTIEISLDNYRKGYDIVYLDDAPMSGVVKLVSELFSPASD